MHLRRQNGSLVIGGEETDAIVRITESDNTEWKIIGETHSAGKQRLLEPCLILREQHQACLAGNDHIGL